VWSRAKPLRSSTLIEAGVSPVVRPAHHLIQQAERTGGDPVS
jgi:hypothetical protein